MTHRVLGLLLVLLLSVPATGQTPWQPPRTPDGQPDMQGLWRGFSPWPAFSLEGDVREFLEAERAVGGGSLPDPPPSIIVDPADGKIPYQPWALEKRKGFIENMLAPTKLEHIDPEVRAFLEGIPRVNFLPGEIQILQVPDYVVFVYQRNHEYRVVPVDGRPHVGVRHSALYGGLARALGEQYAGRRRDEPGYSDVAGRAEFPR